MIPFSLFYVYISSTSSRPSPRSVSQHLSVASIDSVMTADGRKLIVSGGASFFSCGVWLNILSNLFRAAAADPYLGMCILPVMKNELVKCLVVEGRSKHQGCVDGFDLIIPGEVLKNCLDDIEFSYDHTVSFWICSSVAKEIRFWIILY